MRISQAPARPAQRPIAARTRARSARSRREAPPAEQRLSSSVSLPRHRGASVSEVLSPRLALAGIALVVTTVWFIVNVPRLALLDLLPFASSWLEVWAVLVAGHVVWSRLKTFTRR